MSVQQIADMSPTEIEDILKREAESFSALSRVLVERTEERDKARATSAHLFEQQAEIARLCAGFFDHSDDLIDVRQRLG